MKLFTRYSPYYHLLKHFLFLLKHPVYIYIFVSTLKRKLIKILLLHRRSFVNKTGDCTFRLFFLMSSI